MLRSAVCVCLTCVAFGAMACADPGAVTWSGGTLCLMADHPTISLISEKLVLEPQPVTTCVTASLEFRNEGDSCTAEMGFPMLTVGGNGYHYVTGFVVDVDGELLESRQHEGPIRLGEREWQCKWYLFSVPFKAGQARHMRVRYDETRMHSGMDRVRVPYLLATGATWNGAIRDLQVEVRLGDRLNFHQVQLKGDDKPLEVAERDDTLFWEMADYDGKPGALSFEAAVGPMSVERADGRGEYWDGTKVRWRRGVLLVEADFLSELLLAPQTWASPTTVQFVKEDQKVGLTAWQLPGGQDGAARTFVEPTQALEAFGGAIEVTIDEAGDATVKMTPCPESGESARATALYPRQDSEYRLRCLRGLEDRWPDGLEAVCREILARPREDAAALAWSAAYLADADPDAVDLTAIPAKLQPAEGGWMQHLVETILTTRYDGVVRGGGLVLSEADREAARDLLVSRISQCENWMDGVARGRNAGLALRVMQAPDAAETLMSAIRSYRGAQPGEDAFVALGMLGDESAIEFCVDAALDPDARTNDIRCSATEAVSLIGTPDALKACADLYLRTDNKHVRWSALHGMEVAMGEAQRPSSYHPEPWPAWARPLSVEEASRVCVPLLERLLPRARELEQERDVTSLMETARARLAAVEATAAGG